MLVMCCYNREGKLLLYLPEISVLKRPLFSSGISAGFPSPADDFLEGLIDLNELLIVDEEATFFGFCAGDSMDGIGIDNGDLLVIDKSLEPQDGDIAVCFLDGAFTMKRIRKESDNSIWLLAENKKYPPLKITEDNEFVVWGIVTASIKRFGNGKKGKNVRINRL